MKQHREMDSDKLRTQILNISEAVICYEGLGSYSIQKVATELGNSPAIIYHYFKDKEEIISAVLEQSYTLILQAIRKEVKTKDYSMQLQERFLNYYEAIFPKKQLYLLIMTSKNPNLKEKNFNFK